MKIVDSFLTESYPKNPEKIVIKNKYYPTGLTEKEVYEYYQNNKKKILDWIGERYVAFFLELEDQMLIKRKDSKGNFIRLKEGNFDELITGRTLQIHVQIPVKTNYFVVDIDSRTEDFKEIKKAAKIVKEITEKDLDVRFFEFLFTSTTGIHTIGYMNQIRNIDDIRKTLFKLLNENQEKYRVNIREKKTRGINFDLSPNYKNSLHISRYSLTKEGLICDDIRRRGGKKI